MKSFLFCLPALLFAVFVRAQTTADTTIYNIGDKAPMPLINNCHQDLHTGWTEDSTRRCAESQLLGLLTRNIRYPEEARNNNVEGTVVASFVVEPNGRITNIVLLKDIGSGCGAEAVRVLAGLDEAGLRWQPGSRAGQAVRMRQVLPLRFKLQEALPYYLTEAGDSVYTQMDSEPVFRGGLDSLAVFVLNQVQYPKTYIDSCRTGIIEMSVLIRPDGSVEVDNQLDFSNLGLDFQFEALRLANRSAEYWQPARYKGQPVTATIPLRALFKSPAAGCATTNEHFDQAMLLAAEGATLLNDGKQEEAITKWTQALQLHPNNGELLYYRGSALLALNRREEACKDFNQVKAMLGVTWFEPVRRLVCGW